MPFALILPVLLSVDICQLLLPFYSAALKSSDCLKILFELILMFYQAQAGHFFGLRQVHHCEKGRADVGQSTVPAQLAAL